MIKEKEQSTLKVVQAIVICVIKKEEAIMNLKIKNRGCEAQSIKAGAMRLWAHLTKKMSKPILM